MNEKVVTIVRNPFQKRIKTALETNKKIVACFGGWGSGKTDYAAIEHVFKRQLYGNSQGLHLIAANTYSQLIDSTLRPLYSRAKEFGIPIEPKELPQGHRPFNIELYNGQGWTTFLCRSMENINTIAGLTLSSAWCDEMWDTEKWSFDLILSRLRDKKSKHLQLLLTSNTTDPEHYLFTDIVQKWELNQKTKDGLYPRDFIEIVYGTTYDNQRNVPKDYISAMATTLDPAMFDRFILSKWVSIGQGKMFYKFSREKNISKDRLIYEPNLPLLVSSDFNVSPMCWSIWQQHKDVLWCIDQIMIAKDADTETACKELYGRYSNIKHLTWFGDASGESSSTKSQNSDYDIIRRFFRTKEGIELTMKVPKANPSIRDSANAVNTKLENAKGEIGILFDPISCPDVILSVEGTSYRPGTSEKDDSKDRDPKAKIKTHFGDTTRYIVNTLFPIRKTNLSILFEA